MTLSKWSSTINWLHQIVYSDMFWVFSYSHHNWEEIYEFHLTHWLESMEAHLSGSRLGNLNTERPLVIIITYKLMGTKLGKHSLSYHACILYISSNRSVDNLSDILRRHLTSTYQSLEKLPFKFILASSSQSFCIWVRAHKNINSFTKYMNRDLWADLSKIYLSSVPFSISK